MVRVTSLFLVAAGCHDVVCDLAEVPIVDPTGLATHEELDQVRASMIQFEEWTGRRGQICLSSVELYGSDSVGANRLDDEEYIPAGRYVHRLRKVQLQVSWGTNEQTVYHELCHALDAMEDLTATHDHLFSAEAVEASERYPTVASRRGEHLARLCEAGPRGPVIEQLEATCGDPTLAFIEGEVWRTAGPDLDVRLVEPPEETRVEVARLDGVYDAIDQRWLSSCCPTLADPEYVHLSAEGVPDGQRVAPLPSRTDYDLTWWTIPTEDTLLFAHAGGPPQILSADGSVVLAEVSADDWGGGAWIDGRWWVDARDEILVLSADGILLDRHPRPEGSGYGVVAFGGEPAVIVSARFEQSVLRIPDGALLATLPADIWFHRGFDGFLLGNFRREPAASHLLEFFGAWQSEVWVDAAGRTSVASPCGQGASLAGRLVWPHPETRQLWELLPDEVTAIDHVVTHYPVD